MAQGKIGVGGGEGRGRGKHKYDSWYNFGRESLDFFLSDFTM